MAKVDEKDLKMEINDIRERIPSLRDDAAFVAWFMKCFVTNTEAEGVMALVGGSKDKNLDAIHIDDKVRKVFIVQGKYRQHPNSGMEKRNDVVSFANLAHNFTDEGAFNLYREGLAAAAVDKAENSHKCITKEGYGLRLYYVTLGKCSQKLAEESQKIVRQASSQADIDIIDGKRVLQLLSDYLDGVAPPVPLLEVELENGKGIKLDGVLQRFDQQASIESWVVPVSVSQIAKMYESAGVRLFARNVRGFLEDTPVNRNMKETLEKEPELFWYYNNGITIVCDKAEKVSRSGQQVLRLVNPQIINGQQTTRTLSECANKSTKASVMVRIISVPRDSDADVQRFENLVSRIVGATNWQNAIRASDLMSNDRRQIELERNLRKIDYQYLRKRQSKGEAKKNAGVTHRFIVTKEEFAQVSAACDQDPRILREGKEQLFEEGHYATVFPNGDPDYYLPRYWLNRQVTKEAKGFPERQYAKWLVLHLLWQWLDPLIRKKTRNFIFRIASEKGKFQYLPKAINAVFKIVSSYYRKNCGTGETRVDPSNFFNRKGQHKEIEKLWSSFPLGHISAFNKAWKSFQSEMDQLENE